MRLRHLMLFLLLAFPAFAQTGSLRGTLSDAVTRQPLADVVVTASSPQLERERVVVTDHTGGYRIPELPPGPYSLTFERESFQRDTRAGILLRAHHHVRIDATLLPARASTDETTPAIPPAINIEAICGDLDLSSFVRRNGAAPHIPREMPVRGFVPLAELAPRSDVTVFAVSSEVPDSVFIVEGINPDDPGSHGIEDALRRLHAPEWTHAYPEMVRPTGLPHTLHRYPADDMRQR